MNLILSTAFLLMLPLLTSAGTLPKDPLIKKQWALRYDSKAPGANILPVWKNFKLKYSPVVAVIDSGIDVNHPDLKDALWVNKKEIPNNGIDDDKNGYVDDVHGFGFFDHNADLTDSVGHGTHVSGIIGASHNSIGIAGVNPKAKIMMLKVAGSDPDDMDDKRFWKAVCEAIGYAVNQGVEVINMSLGDSSKPACMKSALEKAARKNITVVIAAGNTGDDEMQYPASYRFENIISVAASNDTKGIRALFSTVGKKNVDIFAPGERILSTCTGSEGPYCEMDGTSMASPLVAGISSLLLSIYGPIKPRVLRKRLMETSRRYETTGGLVASNGLINAEGAVTGQTSMNLIWDKK